MPYSAPLSKEVAPKKDYTCLDLDNPRPTEIRALIEDADSYAELEKIEVGLSNNLRMLRMVSETRYNAVSDFMNDKGIYDCSIYDCIRHKRAELHIAQSEIRRKIDKRAEISTISNQFRDAIIDCVIITGNIIPTVSEKYKKNLTSSSE